ncbi:MAG: phage major capsid protein [Bermanella sp.]
MALEQKDIDQVTDALGAKFDEMKKTNDKELEQIKSEVKGAARGSAEEVKELQKLKGDLEALLAKQNRPGNNNNATTDEHKEAFMKFMKKGHEDGLGELQVKALSVGTDADGGYAVPESIDSEISSVLRDANVMRQAARVITVGNADYKKLMNQHGASSGWVGEEDARPETATPKLAQITPFMGEIYANPMATQTMLDDSFFNAESWLAEEVRDEFAEQEEAAFTLGDGLKKPKGFLAYGSDTQADGARAFGTLQHKLSSGVGVITADDIKRFPYLLRARYRKGASWMGNGNTLADLMLLKNSQGDYIWRPGLSEGMPATVGGFSYLENESMPDTAAGANALSFGNFQRGYYIVDRMGTRVLRDPFTKKPFIGFYTTKRVGGMVVDSNAIKLLQVAAA